MIGEVAALGAAVAFGMSTILARHFMDAVTPEAGVLVSIVTNALVFVLLTVIAAALGLLPPVDPVAIGLFAAGGLAGTLLGRNLSYQSIDRLGASLSVTIRLSNSIFSLLLGFMLLRELPRLWQLGGLVLVTAGLWLSLRPAQRPAGQRAGEAAGAADLSGVLMALGSSAAFALGDVARRAGLNITPAPVLGAAVGACSALTAHLLWSIFRPSARWPPLPALRRFDMLGSAILSTAAIILLYLGLRHAPVAIVAVLYNLQVLVVLVVGPMILRGQERVTVWLAAGALVALIGTVLILFG